MKTEPIHNLEIAEGSDNITPTPFNNNARAIASIIGPFSDSIAKDKTHLISMINEALRTGSNPPPYFNSETLTWWQWDVETMQYVDTTRPASATVDVESTTTLPPGSDATVDNVGTPLDVQLRFGIPEGKEGKQGDQGPIGPTGHGFVVLGIFPTLADLQFVHPVGERGDSWAVGTSDDNTVYTWDINSEAWVDIGSIGGVPKSLQQQVDDNTANISVNAAAVAEHDTRITANTTAISEQATAIETLLAPALTTTHTILPTDWQPHEGRYAAVITQPEEGNARYPDPDVRFGIDDLGALNAAGMGPIGAEYDDDANILRLVALEIPAITVSPEVTWRSSYA